MSEEIDVEALLDAPFKCEAEVDNKAKTENAQNVETTHATATIAGAADETKINRSDTNPTKDVTVSITSSSKAAERKDASTENKVSDSRNYADGQSRRRSRHRSPGHSQPRSRSREKRHKSRHSRRRDYYDSDGSDYGDKYYSRERYERRSRREPSADYSRENERGDESYYREHRDDRRASHRSASRYRSPSPTVDESERDMRTVFAMQLAAQIRRSDLVDFFSRAGRVRDAHIVSEKSSRRSRGIAYIEFYEVSSAAKAVELSGERLLGVPIIVQPSEAEKNRQSQLKQYSSSGTPLASADSDNNLVFVGDLFTKVESDDLKTLFEPFGQIDCCRVVDVCDSKGVALGDEWMAFVKYALPESAHVAARKMDRLRLLGHRLHVRLASRSERDRQHKFDMGLLKNAASYENCSKDQDNKQVKKLAERLDSLDANGKTFADENEAQTQDAGSANNANEQNGKSDLAKQEQKRENEVVVEEGTSSNDIVADGNEHDE